MRTILERRLAARGEEELDEGFTLIELLVVLLILGILIAIAIPTFMNITKSASKTAAESNLQTALTGADAYYQSNSESYTGIMNAANTTASDIEQQQTGLDYLSGTTDGSTNAHVINLEVTGNTNSAGTVLAMTSASTTNGECYGILDVKQTYTPSASMSINGTATTPVPPGTYFGAATVAPSADAASCTAPNLLASTANWKFSSSAFPA